MLESPLEIRLVFSSLESQAEVKDVSMRLISPKKGIDENLILKRLESEDPQSYAKFRIFVGDIKGKGLFDKDTKIIITWKGKDRKKHVKEIQVKDIAQIE